MADSEDVLRSLEPTSRARKSSASSSNHKGAERAIITGKVHTLGFPYSVSHMFLQRNQNQTQKESREVLKDIASLFRRWVGSRWRMCRWHSAIRRTVEGRAGCQRATTWLRGRRQISLAEHSRPGNPERVAEVFAAALMTVANRVGNPSSCPSRSSGREGSRCL